MLESPQSIEPARLQDVPETISDLVAELSAAAAKLERTFQFQHPFNGLQEIYRQFATIPQNVRFITAPPIRLGQC